MPLDYSIRSVLVLGAGPIVIGQACEFDYSGAQACRALKDEGIRVALLNSNPATIMTDPEMADATYIAPVDADSAQNIIARENISAVLPTMGGQTALNCAMELHRRGVFSQSGGPKLIGASAESIAAAEDRELFKQAMANIGLQTPESHLARTLESAIACLEKTGFPAIIRPSFTLGGAGGGIAYNREEFETIARRGLSESPDHSILVERSLIGWKEFEMEVVRDSADNCVIVCAIENLDPMGVHTGDSITVAPAQTLTDKEYQVMRDSACAVLREIGVDTGGANVQFAVNPETGESLVIEMNPRVSRSSALASKATGFPIAKVAARLAVGHTLDEIKNDITGVPASFEPSLDYVVTKIPRFDFDKFAPAPDALTTQMKSVGEVMAMGGTFAESLQKALRGLEIGATGLDPVSVSPEETAGKLSRPHSRRIFHIAQALRDGTPAAEVNRLTGVDMWFLNEIENVVAAEKSLDGRKLDSLSPNEMRELKRMGFSDSRLASLLGADETAVREWRWGNKVRPGYRRVDACAGEFPAATCYMYSTYTADPEAKSENAGDELRPTSRRKALILGGGPNRIGQGIEFDYCCIHAAEALSAAGYETLMVNSNPETVSTDYDISDRLFFEPLTAEDVLEIVAAEKPEGIVVQFGGQTPLKIARVLERESGRFGARILGTSVAAIDLAEDRRRFQGVIESCGLRQPENATVANAEEAKAAAAKIGFPILARPSYVLGGLRMRVLSDDAGLDEYFRDLPPDILALGRVLLDKYLDPAVEVDVDAVADETGDVVVAGIMRHIEAAGVHSGDSSCVLPPEGLPPDLVEEMRRQTMALARELGVVGLMNVQFAAREGEVYVLEVNPRASRTVPFVSKASGIHLAKIAARAMAGETLAAQKIPRAPKPSRVCVKEAALPFHKFPEADPLLGPEMKSTGEAMGIAETFPDAFLLAQEAVHPSQSFHPVPGTGETIAALFSVRDADKPMAAEAAKILADLGWKIIATPGTAAFLNESGVEAERVEKVAHGRPHVVDRIVSGDARVVVNTESESAESRRDSFSIRQAALRERSLYFTTMAGAIAMARGLSARAQTGRRPELRPLQEFFAQSE